MGDTARHLGDFRGVPQHRESLERFQHFRGVTVDAYCRPNPSDLSAGVDEERRSFPRAKCIVQRTLAIGQESEWQAILPFEFLMRFDRISTHADYARAFCLERC